MSWKNVSDGFFGGSIGAVAVSPSDPNVLYVGGGEKTVRGNVSHGYGVWRSTDAGKTWTAAGLGDSHHIPRMRVHPEDPDHVYAAVLGHLYEDHPTRGIYRSRDGGESWQRILHVSDAVGAAELAMDPTNPRILYATFWRVRRTPWSLSSGGEGSGIWKSTDGGESWKEITRNEGLPQGTVGISGISVSPTNPQNLYAIIEAEDGGVFRSRDGGETWERTSEDRSLRQRAWYYTRIYADPQDEDSVYVPNVRFHHSKDGGRSFRQIATPHGDHHDLWISEEDPRRMIHGSDGGASVSFDGGETWSRQDNQPTAQMYRLSVDDHTPFRIYGGQQDNSAIRIAHRSDGSGIGFRDWEPTAGGESGHIVADPKNPDIVYGGSYGGYLTRLDHRTGLSRVINVWPDNPMGWAAKDLRYRFQWNFPIFFSRHDPEALYAAGNLLFQSTDEGQSWTAVSPDLTRNDSLQDGIFRRPHHQRQHQRRVLRDPLRRGGVAPGGGGPVDRFRRWPRALDSGFREELGGHHSPRPSHLGHHQRPRGEPPRARGGLCWRLPPTAPGTSPPTSSRRRISAGAGPRIDGGIDRQHFTRAIRADPQRKGLLFAGTESGIYVSFDDGGRWQPLQLNLPIVPITDLAIKGDHLVAATQGRGYWVFDHLPWLRLLGPGSFTDSVELFAPAPARLGAGGGRSRPRANAGTNPEAGAVIFYHLNAPSEDLPVRIEILEEDGTLIRSFERKVPASDDSEGDDSEGDGKEKADEEDSEEPKVTAEEGLNRFVWDLEYPPPTKVPGMVFWGSSGQGPEALPGNYLVRLTAGGESKTAQFRVVQDPRSTASREALEARFEFLKAVRGTLDEAHRGILEIRSVKEQLEGVRDRLRDDQASVETAAKDLAAKLTAIEEALYQTKNRSAQDPLNFPIRLNNKLTSVAGSVASSLHRPTAQAEAVRGELTKAIETELSKLDTILEEDLVAFNALVRDEEVPAVARPREAQEETAPGQEVETEE